MRQFTRGQRVKLPDNMEGIVEFISEEYITVCISVKKNDCPHSLSEFTKCCILVYPKEQEQLVILSEEITPESMYKAQENRYSDIQ